MHLALGHFFRLEVDFEPLHLQQTQPLPSTLTQLVTLMTSTWSINMAVYLDLGRLSQHVFCLFAHVQEPCSTLRISSVSSTSYRRMANRDPDSSRSLGV